MISGAGHHYSHMPLHLRYLATQHELRAVEVGLDHPLSYLCHPHKPETIVTKPRYVMEHNHRSWLVERLNNYAFSKLNYNVKEFGNAVPQKHAAKTLHLGKTKYKSEVSIKPTQQ